MFKFKGLWICLILTFYLGMALQAHEGYHHSSHFFSEDYFADVDSLAWLSGIGKLHFLLLHFPIALIIMTVVAEFLWIWFGNIVFSHAARFMILSAAIFALPTAFLGLAMSYGQSYQGIFLDLFVWHRYFGFLTAGLAILAAILRERYLNESSSSLKSYYVCLFLLFISVSLTGTFGGSLTFGLDALNIFGPSHSH